MKEVIDDIDIQFSECLRGNEQIEKNKKIKKILWHCYGIKVKTIKINDTKSYIGYTFYIPFCIMTKNDVDCDDIVATLWNKKVYKTLEEILYSARKGELELI